MRRLRALGTSGAGDGDHRARWTTVFVVCNNVLVLIISTLMTHVPAEPAAASMAATTQTVAHIAMIATILVFGEIVPKTYGSGPSGARAVAGMMSTLIRLLGPVIVVMNYISGGIMRALGLSG